MKRSQYGYRMEIMENIRQAGIEQIGMVTEPLKKGHTR